MQFLVLKQILIKFLLLSALPTYLTACSAPRTVSPKSEPVKQISEVTKGVEIQPEENPSKYDVEVVESKITDWFINRIFERAEEVKDSNSIENQKDLSSLKNGDSRYFLDLKHYRKQLAGMLKQGCIDDAYSFSSNRQIISKLESLKWFAHVTAWKVKDGQYLVSFKCGHGMSLKENAVFLLTETTGEPEVKPLRLVKVSRDKETGEFQFRSMWNTLVFGSFGPSYNEQTGVLSIETKGNGAGQLRSSWKYRIENNDFVLVEFRDRDWDYKGSDIPRIYP
jgi:hypothetical protein